MRALSKIYLTIPLVMMSANLLAATYEYRVPMAREYAAAVPDVAPEPVATPPGTNVFSLDYLSVANVWADNDEANHGTTVDKTITYNQSASGERVDGVAGNRECVLDNYNNDYGSNGCIVSGPAVYIFKVEPNLEMDYFRFISRDGGSNTMCDYYLWRWVETGWELVVNGYFTSYWTNGARRSTGIKTSIPAPSGYTPQHYRLALEHAGGMYCSVGSFELITK